MMPVAPSPRKPSSFSIESLMGRRDPPSSSASRPPQPRSPTPEPVISSPRTSTPSSSPRDLTRDSRQPLSPREARDPTMGGIGSSFQPVTPGASALLNGLRLKGLPHAHPGLPADHPLHGLDGLQGLHPHLPPLPGLHGPHGGPLPGGLGPLQPPHPGLHPGALNPLMLGPHREMLPFYPWLMSRHGAYLHRFAGPEGFLLQPFRKPKRIRTAFSPSQLLRLEHAFEKNHYVVGQERKELAASLNLSETQVKVWFQNRRTKYKRVKSEEEEDGPHGERRSGSPSPHAEGDQSHQLETSHDSGSELDLEDDDDEIDISGPEHPALAHAHAQALAAAQAHHLSTHWRPEQSSTPINPVS